MLNDRKALIENLLKFGYIKQRKLEKLWKQLTEKNLFLMS